MKQTRRPQAPWLDANEIKRMVPIGAVLDKYLLRVHLEQRGSSLIGPSPFSESGEKTFSVNIDRGIWNDGAQRPTVDGREVSGNVIGLVQALEGCSFREALEILAAHVRENAGEVVDEPQESSASPDISAQAARAQAFRTAAQQQRGKANAVFGKELGGLRWEVPFLQEEHGITPATAEEFGVGFATRGLMKNRIAIPVRNVAGEIVAYGGRSLREDDPAGKYRYPTEFKQGLEVFNIDRVVQVESIRERVAQLGLVVVNSPLEVLQLHQTGIPNAVAPLGRVPTEEQASMLANLTTNPSLKLTLVSSKDEESQKKRRAWARLLIRRAFVRFSEDPIE